MIWPAIWTTRLARFLDPGEPGKGLLFDAASYFDNQFDEHQKVAAATLAAVKGPFLSLLDVCCDCLSSDGKVLFFGNGGSAADAQHLATELTVRFSQDRPAIPALALTTDSSALTAIGNDFGFAQIFARQVQALGHHGDVALGISTSGRSENVIKALEAARAKGVIPAALTGGDGGGLVGLADPLLVVPSKTTARIQEMHILIGQMLCGAIEKKLGLVP